MTVSDISWLVQYKKKENQSLPCEIHFKTKRQQPQHNKNGIYYLHRR